jgi:hypothetical protein
VLASGGRRRNKIRKIRELEEKLREKRKNRNDKKPAKGAFCFDKNILLSPKNLTRFFGFVIKEAEH